MLARIRPVRKQLLTLLMLSCGLCLAVPFDQARAQQPQPAAECPRELNCRVVPAAYQQNDAKNAADYGNYDIADRGNDGLEVRYIIIHDTEISYDATIALFQRPTAYVSAHYVLRAADGEITQMVDTSDVAWTAGNWYINSHAINLEHEGVAIEGTRWFTDAYYRSSAQLVRYLANKYNVPLDRAHIIGSDEVPGPTAKHQTAMHWDPGPYWDWSRYMELLGAPLTPPTSKTNSNILTIKPAFATNRPPLSHCFADGCREVPRQPANFVYLYTAPSFEAPLLDDPALPGPGTTRAADWGNKAVTGQRFFRAQRQGDWDGIYFGGQLAWLHNPGGINTLPGGGMLITPKAGTIPVYGRAYPEATAYPAGIQAEPFEPLQYTISAGQTYVATELVNGSFYWSPDQSRRGVIKGVTPYYAIFFNHRLAYVKASDVNLVWRDDR